MTRELDALIAEHVMGWEVRVIDPDGLNMTCIMDGNEIVRGFDEDNTGWKPSAPDGIADAWLVVEKLGLLTGGHILKENPRATKNRWKWGYEQEGFYDWYVSAPTAPEAICKAA